MSRGEICSAVSTPGRLRCTSPPACDNMSMRSLLRYTGDPGNLAVHARTPGRGRRGMRQREQGAGHAP
eukprot:1039996-Prymnesium_polylepis.2